MRSRDELRTFYHSYIDCLNGQNWSGLARFVSEIVTHNGRFLGIDGYREMLENDYRRIPDLRFEVEVLATEPPYIAARLRFNCSPQDGFLGLDFNGRSVSFCEHVFYEISGGQITSVHSIIDKAAIESQLL